MVELGNALDSRLFIEDGSAIADGPLGVQFHHLPLQPVVLFGGGDQQLFIALGSRQQLLVLGLELLVELVLVQYIVLELLDGGEVAVQGVGAVLQLWQFDLWVLLEDVVEAQSH